MDIINYSEIDKLEEHIINRKIQEALLDPNTCNWAIAYDKKNLGKNLAIAYGLSLSEWEQYKSLEEMENMQSLPSGGGKAFIILAKHSLKLADKFYDKLLPDAIEKQVTITGTTSPVIVPGEVTLLKYDFSQVYNGGTGRHGTLGIVTKIEGDAVVTDIQDGRDVTKCVAKFNDLTLTRAGCTCNYKYTIWHI